MAKTDKRDFAPAAVEASTEVRTPDGVVLNPVPKLAPEKTAPTEGRLTFSMYCTVRAIPVQRQAGMRAFTKTNEATLSEWDATFKRY